MLEKPVKAIQSHGQHRTQQGKQNEKKLDQIMGV